MPYFDPKPSFDNNLPSFPFTFLSSVIDFSFLTTPHMTVSFGSPLATNGTTSNLSICLSVSVSLSLSINYLGFIGCFANHRIHGMNRF
mmetsp:Transcript_11889/g.14383  ORF Transcript_11889/g.14383 Transcript_11889/m.14383 type:complete len:88 (-) Transcript_11889:236-499(-)